MLRCSDGGRTGESGKEIGNYRSVSNSDGAWAAACVFHSFGRKRKMPREEIFYWCVEESGKALSPF